MIITKTPFRMLCTIVKKPRKMTHIDVAVFVECGAQHSTAIFSEEAIHVCSATKEELSYSKTERVTDVEQIQHVLTS